MPDKNRGGGTELVHRRVEAHARATPDAVAVVCGERALTYRELDDASARLANHLIRRGVRGHDVVVICLDRSADLPVSVLAVLRAGAAYVMLEPSAPDGVLREVLRAVAPSAVLTRESHRIRLADAVDAGIVCLDTEAGAIAGESAAGPDVQITGSAPAFLAHTARSPATSVVEHSHLAGALRDWKVHYGLTPGDRVLQTASVESVVFTGDWVRALGTGATLVVLERNFTSDRTADVDELAVVLADERITVLECETPVVRRLLRRLAGEPATSVRLLAVSGESWFVREHREAQRILGPDARVLHVYRIPESPRDICRLEPTELGGPDDVSLIGRPVTGARVSVTDARRRRRRKEVPGVGTLAVKVDGAVKQTRDLGIRRSDGLLQYVGRADVRVPGLSPSDVAECEAALRSLPGVSDAVVAGAPVRRGESYQDTEDEAVAYVVTDPEQVLFPHLLIAVLVQLRGGAPAPRTIVAVPALPRDRRGAVDRDRLPRAPKPKYSRSGGKGTRPGGAVPGDRLPHYLGAMLLIAVPVALPLYFLTSVIWPGSTNTAAVPQPWAAFFQVLYAAEAASLGLGVAYLFMGYSLLSGWGCPRWLTVLTHLAIAWLLLAWWPQDNLYRLSSPQDWPRQGVLVFVFNVALMLAAAVVVLFFCAAARAAARADRSR
ncbi:AMP-binding protein [Amycolatopsis sp. NBC_00345]|uniref:AMP-binding protein n=1 Tax=Amycolatopsis sp. NBC_00345 TaxID=2975955 RepID=UPI002E25AA7E